MVLLLAWLAIVLSSWIRIRLHAKNQLPRLPITKLRPSSTFNKIEVVFHISSSLVETMLLTKNLLPRSAGKQIEVVFHILSIWVKIMLHSEIQLPMYVVWQCLKSLSGCVGWWGGGPTNYLVTPNLS